MRKSHALGSAGLVAAGAVVLLLWRCAGSSPPPDEPRTTTGASDAVEPSAATEQAASVAAAFGDDAANPEARDPDSQKDPVAVPSASGSAPPASSAAAHVNAALQNDPRDLALFARIERELKRDPPPAVNQMTELRARGATRDELLGEARRLFADDFRLRALVVRWIDEVAPPAGGAKKPVSAPSGAGSGAPIVQPIRAK
jgi:hypothetical protein